MIRTIKNQYRGINAHLHSHWQRDGGWDSFHSNHITYLTSALKAKLLPMGYTADTQQSLQIRRLGEPAGKPESDVTIYDRDPARSSRPAISRLHIAPLQPALRIPEAMSIEDELSAYTAIGVYSFYPGQSERGEPVAWIELLSPSNKPGGQDAEYYRNKRQKLLRSGMVFVELDYLHESPSTFDRVAQSTGNGKPHPYRIMVVDPRPVFLEGLVFPAEFDVDDPIPAVTIPLNGDDELLFDFNAPYQRTFEELFYGLELVDYSQLPPAFDRYSRDDQIRILARMLAVMKAARDGIDLETNAPLPVEAVSFEAALSQLNSLQ